MKIARYLLGTILLSLIISCSKDDMSFLRGKARILFISQRIENTAKWQLFSMKNDGTDQQKIIDLEVRCEKPVISHSGKTALFVHYTDDFFYELYSVDVDGTNLTLIDRSNRYCGSADWSFDDSKIVYSKSRSESTDELNLFIFDVSTGTKRALTDLGSNSSGKFSRNDQIAYSHQLDGGWCDVYLINTDGSGNRKVITKASNPVWSPDGKRIAYQSPIENGSSQIFVASNEGANQKQLTFTYSSRIWPGWAPDGNYDFKWTPDGKKIVYVSWEDENPEIYSMNSDGSNKVRLTNADKRDENPEITADGKFILFSSNRNLDMNAEIFIMNLDGRNQRSLTNYSGSDIYPIEIK